MGEVSRRRLVAGRKDMESTRKEEFRGAGPSKKEGTNSSSLNGVSSNVWVENWFNL